MDAAGKAVEHRVEGVALGACGSPSQLEIESIQFPQLPRVHSQAPLPPPVCEDFIAGPCSP
jgi:hypothetical protein